MAKKLYCVDGIKVKIEEKIFTDYRFGKMNLAISKELPAEDDENYESEVVKRSKISEKLVAFVLGNEEDRVVDQIAKMHGGYASYEDVFSWLTKLCKKVGAAKK